MLDTLTIRPALPFDAAPLHAYLAAIAAEKLPVLFAREAAPARSAPHHRGALAVLGLTGAAG